MVRSGRAADAEERARPSAASTTTRKSPAASRKDANAVVDEFMIFCEQDLNHGASRRGGGRGRGGGEDRG